MVEGTRSLLKDAILSNPPWALQDPMKQAKVCQLHSCAGTGSWVQPGVAGDFHNAHRGEMDGGLLLALQKPEGGIRPIACGSLWRRCFASLAANSVHTAQEWSWHTFPGPQTCRIRIPLPYHELGLPNIDPNIDKGSY